MMRNDDRRCKLNADLVRKARRLHAEGVRVSELARRFSVGYATMRRAVKGINWSNV